MNLTLEEQILANVILQDLIEKRTPVSYSDLEGFHMSFDITNSARFIDGLNPLTIEQEYVCVAKLYPEVCGKTNSDPFTTGVFDLMYDEPFPKMPEIYLEAE